MKKLSTVCALVALLAGCSGSSGGPAAIPAAFEIEGEWTGTYVSMRGAEGVLGMTIRQVGATKVVTDNLTVAGTGQCFPFPNAEGLWDGIELELEMAAELNSGGLLRVNTRATSLGSMSGGYEVVGGPCVGDQGIITLTRTR